MRTYLRQPVQGIRYITLSIILAAMMTAADFPAQQGELVHFQHIIHYLVLPFFALFGRSAYFLPLALGAIGLLRMWRMHHIPRARWSVRILLSLPITSASLTGMDLLANRSSESGGLIGKFYFHYLSLMTGGALNQVSSLAIIICFALILWGVRPWAMLGTARKQLSKSVKAVTAGAGKNVTAFVQRSPLDKTTCTKLTDFTDENIAQRWQPRLSGQWVHETSPERGEIIEKSRVNDEDELPSRPLPQPVDDSPIPLDILPDPVVKEKSIPDSVLDELEEKIIAIVQGITGITLLRENSRICLNHILLRFQVAENGAESVEKVRSTLSNIGLATGRAPACVRIDDAVNFMLPLSQEERVPVPVKPLLRECMPNQKVGPHDITFLLGRKQDGEPVEIPVRQCRNLLVAGATGGGKTNCLHALIMSLIFRYPPSAVRLALVDFKRFEFFRYKGMKHLWQEVVTTREEFQVLLDNLTAELERRKQVMMKDENAIFPALIIIVDEFAGYNDDRFIRLVAEIRAVNMHVILATQHPVSETISTAVKVNLLTSIAFKVRSSTASHLIIGSGDAVCLLPDGDCLLQTPLELFRVQTAWVSNGGDDSDSAALRKYLAHQETEWRHAHEG